jgi:hypothetical protein
MQVRLDSTRASEVTQRELPPAPSRFITTPNQSEIKPDLTIHRLSDLLELFG